MIRNTYGDLLKPAHIGTMKLQDIVEEVYQIGDFRQTRKIASAVHEGYWIARNL